MPSLTLAEVAAITGGRLEGDPAAVVEGPESLTRARKKHITFFTGSGAHVDNYHASKAGCVLVKDGVEKPANVLALVRVTDPDEAFSKVYSRMLRHPKRPAPGIHPTAVISPSAKVDATAHIGAYAVLGDEVTIGANSIIHSHCVLMESSSVGANSVLYPHCVLREFVKLGNNVVMQPGAVIGADGFGYRFRDGELRQTPQLGNVELEDEVHIGANSSVDRARFGKTRVGKGTKIDNLVQVGHNVDIGMACGVAALTGIGGSTTIGDFADLSGQSGIPNDITIGPGAKLLARCGPYFDVPAGAEVFGSPPLPRRQFFTTNVLLERSPEVLRFLKRVAKKLDIPFEDSRKAPGAGPGEGAA